MDLKYEKPSFRYMIDMILEFQKTEQGDFFKESLYYFYEDIDKDKFNRLEEEQRNKYIESFFEPLYKANESLFLEKIKDYQLHWDNNKEIIISTFEDIFDIRLGELFNNMIGQISLNPVCPRFLDTYTFDIFYLNSQKGALGISLHEIIHFVWFKKWNEHFKDNYSEYETPSLKWIFSEIVVDAILRDDRIKDLNPYERTSYEYFYDIEIEGENMMDIIYDLYKSNDIISFMERGYAFVIKYEDDIRNVMY